MRKLPVYAIMIALVAISISIACAADSDPASVTAIKALEANFVAAVNAKDAAKIMANYEHSSGLVIFDLIPPRQYTGWDAYKKDWEGVLAGCKSAPTMEMTDLAIDAGADLGFGHNIQHFSCTGANGAPMDLTFRVTDGYKKIHGKWLIAHEHVSVPVDLETGKADLNSKP
ncbi:MAG: nuclear transport factor 2 family protein [Candidatus Binataceae bacterium]